MIGADDSIAARLLQRVRDNPDGEAFEWYIDANRSTVWSWADLHRQACAQAARIAQMAAPQSRIVLALPQGLPFIAAWFGCHYARCIPVSLCPPDTAVDMPRFLRAIADCKPAVLMTTTAIEGELRTHGATLPPRLYPEEIATAPYRDIGFELALPRADDFALLQYTAGVTAESKSAMVSHRDLIASAAAIASTSAQGDAPRLVSWLPFFHDMGLIAGICYPVYAGIPATLFATTSFLRRPLLWLRLISQRRATISPAPDFACNLCARIADDVVVAALDLSCWRSAICGTGLVPRATAERFIARFSAAGFGAASFVPWCGVAETMRPASAESHAALAIIRTPAVTPPRQVALSHD